MKEGALSAAWTTQNTGVTRIALAGDRIGALLADGTYLVKEGALTAGWVTESAGVREIALSNGQQNIR